MFTLEPPLLKPLRFEDDTRGLKDIIERGHKEIFENLKPPGMCPALWDTVKWGWDINPLGRPSMAQVKEGFTSF